MKIEVEYEIYIKYCYDFDDFGVYVKLSEVYKCSQERENEV